MDNFGCKNTGLRDTLPVNRQNILTNILIISCILAGLRKQSYLDAATMSV